MSTIPILPVMVGDTIFNQADPGDALPAVQAEIRQIVMRTLQGNRRPTGPIRLLFDANGDQLTVDINNLPTALDLASIGRAIELSAGFDPERRTFRGYHLTVLGSTGAKPQRPSMAATLIPNFCNN